LEPVSHSERSPLPARRRRSGKAGKKGAAKFLNHLENRTSASDSVGFGVSVVDSEEVPLAELLDAICENGEKVKKEPRRETVFEYKRSVQKLISLVLERAIIVEEQTSSPNILRQKRFTLIKVIDQKLDRLVSEVLVNQRDALELLGRIDEINGLLVDLAG
jgi:hypothetical protein